MAAASQRALAACGALLYPRAAPLHLPHAVTGQARAWGVGASSAGGGGYGELLTSGVLPWWNILIGLLGGLGSLFWE